MTEILRREGKTVILVTHDIGEAISMAERVIVLSRRPGQVKSEHPIRFATPRRPPGAVRGAQRARVQRLFQHALAGARSPCRRLRPRRPRRHEPAISPSGCSASGAAASRCARRSLRILLVFLVLWEVLPKAHIINPMLTSYPSALWPTFLELLKATPQQASILAHTWATVLATVVGFTAAMVLGTAIAAALWWWDCALQGARSVSGGGQRHAEDRVRADLLHLARRHAVDLRHVAGDLAVHHHPDDLQRLPGHRSEQGQARADLRREPRAQILTKVVLPGSVPTLIAALKVNAGLSLVGVVVGEFQSANLGLGYLIQYGSQIFKMNIVMTAITHPRGGLVGDVSGDLVAGDRRDAAAVTTSLSSPRKRDRSSSMFRCGWRRREHAHRCAISRGTTAGAMR